MKNLEREDLGTHDVSMAGILDQPLITITDTVHTFLHYDRPPTVTFEEASIISTEALNDTLQNIAPFVGLKQIGAITKLAKNFHLHVHSSGPIQPTSTHVQQSRPNIPPVPHPVPINTSPQIMVSVHKQGSHLNPQIPVILTTYALGHNRHLQATHASSRK